jgi:hypothetical protein
MPRIAGPTPSTPHRTLTTLYPKPSALLGTDLTRKSHQIQAMMTTNDFHDFLEPKIREQAQRFEQHPLLTTWLADGRPSPKRALAYMTPLMIEFVMGFPDFNKYYLKYPNPKTMFEEVINAHTREDATHSKLFVSDWCDLGVNSLLGWGCSDYMRSVMSPYDQAMKQQGLQLYRLAFENPHPFARFALMETVETAGKHFFSRTAGIAQQLSSLTGGLYEYFGPHHLALESGHLANEDVFYSEDDDLNAQSATLQRRFTLNHRDPKFRNNVTDMVQRVGDIFVTTFDTWLDGAQRFSTDSNFYRTIYMTPETNYRLMPALTNNYFFNSPRESGASLLLHTESIQQGLLRIKQHPLYEELSQSSNSVTRIVTPFALVDLLGTAFLCRFYDWGTNPLLTEVTQEIGNLGDALIADWDALNLNDYGVGFEASQILAFKFFASRSDLHRQHFAEFFKCFLKHNDPVVQYFILHATLLVYQSFLTNLVPCFRSKSASAPLTLFTGEWFDNFHRMFHKKCDAMEKELSTQQRTTIITEVNNIISRFITQLNRAQDALHDEKIDLSQQATIKMRQS